MTLADHNEEDVEVTTDAMDWLDQRGSARISVDQRNVDWVNSGAFIGGSCTRYMHRTNRVQAYQIHDQPK